MLEYKNIFKYLRNKRPKDLDIVCKNISHKVFKDINCLDCARCCKEISPIILEKDVIAITKYLKVDKKKFEKDYLIIDNDGDYIFRSTPCPFLLEDNKCFIYEYRPKACKEYPHIDRKKIYQIENITIENSKICPAVEESLEKLKKYYNL